jgi:Holliday junction resolvase
VAYSGKASKGPADIMAARDGAILMVQVKSCAASPYAHFLPADRRALLEEAQRAGGTATLAYWPPRGKLVFIPSDDWPKVRPSSISANCGLGSTSVEAA